MTGEQTGSDSEGREVTFPFILQLLLLLLLSLHAVAVGVWGVAFIKDLAGGTRNRGALTSADLLRQERERRQRESKHSHLAEKLE